MFYKIITTFLITVLFTGFLSLSLRAEEGDYYTLLEKVKKSDKSVDFRELRFLFTETSDYDPYNTPEEKDLLYDSYDKGNYEEALNYAEALLEKNYVDMDGHYVCKQVYGKLGNKEKSDYHDFVLNGLIDSILNSGNGQSPETAYEVISIEEEYIIMSILGLENQGQELIDEGGHSYDMFTVVIPEKGGMSSLYFKIDVLFQWFSNQFK